MRYEMVQHGFTDSTVSLSLSDILWVVTIPKQALLYNGHFIRTRQKLHTYISISTFFHFQKADLLSEMGGGGPRTPRTPAPSLRHCSECDMKWYSTASHTGLSQ